jgi:hypothetical protein
VEMIQCADCQRWLKAIDMTRAWCGDDVCWWCKVILFDD